MDNYIKKVLKNKLDIEAGEKAVLVRGGNLPVLRKHSARLSEIQETIVKAVYMAGGMFMADLRLMLAFSFESQSVERAVKDLLADGYLIKTKTPYGWFYGLSKEGVGQIKCHPDYYSGDYAVNLQDMDLSGEGAYLKRRCISYAVADYVFRCRLAGLWNKFYTMEIIPRNHYLMKQYLKNILYRQFLLMDRGDRGRLLGDMGLKPEEAGLFLDAEKFIVWTADKFAELVLVRAGFDSLKAEPEYREYISVIKRDALKEPNYNTFYLLKDMLSEEEKTGYHELRILVKWDCNMLKFGEDKVRKVIGLDVPLVDAERKLDVVNRYIGILQNERRSLTNKNAYKKREDDKELADVLVRLAQIEDAVKALRQAKENLETDFGFAVLKNYDGNETDYEERILTFLRLKQNGVFIHALEKKKFCIYVIQQNEDYFDLFSLHKKLGMGFQLLRRLCPLASMEVKVITYSEEQSAYIRSILPALIKKLLESRETAFLGNVLLDVLSIRRASEGLKERYVFYQNIFNELKGEITYDEAEGSDGASKDVCS